MIEIEIQTDMKTMTYTAYFTFKGDTVLILDGLTIDDLMASYHSLTDSVEEIRKIQAEAVQKRFFDKLGAEADRIMIQAITTGNR